jgi:hypothetical protein
MTSKMMRGGYYFIKSTATNEVACGIHRQPMTKSAQGPDFTGRTCELCSCALSQAYMIPRYFYHCEPCGFQAIYICQSCTTEAKNYK